MADAVNLTSGAIAKIMTGKCTENDLQPVLQVTFTDRYGVELTDGCSTHFGCIADDIFISNKLQKGSIVQLTNSQFTNYHGNIRVLLINDLNLIHSERDIIVNSEPFPCNDIPLVETCEDHVDVSRAQESMTSTHKCSENQSRRTKHQSINEIPESDNDEDVDNSHNEQEPLDKARKCSSPSSTQSKNRKSQLSNDNISTQSRKTKHQSSNETIDYDTNEDVDNSHNELEPLATTPKCSSPSSTQSKNRKRQLSNDNISTQSRKTKHQSSNETIDSDTNEDDNISTQSRKTKHQSSNETIDSDTNEDVDNSHNEPEPLATTQKCYSPSLTQSKNRKRQPSNDNISKVVEDVSEMTKLMMEKNRTVDAGFKKLETLEEDVSRLTRMMIEKNKDDDVGACYKKLEVLEDDVGACFKKLKTLEEDVSKLTRMIMEKNKEDDMGACIAKLDKIGWVAQDPMYNTALMLFGQSADYRRLWLHLKPESCGYWVKNAGSMLGLLD